MQESQQLQPGQCGERSFGVAFPHEHEELVGQAGARKLSDDVGLCSLL
jgi:hypothetical protein